MSLTSYNTLITARATATTLGLVKVTAASDAALTAVLCRAAMQIDARRFQGRKFDAGQERQFPRADGDVGVPGVPSVPGDVLTAEVLQAEYLLGSPNSQRQQAISDGVSSQSVGGQSESYRDNARAESLCVEAREQLDKYRLRGGPIV